MHTVDRLESRQFLSAVLSEGTLTITGTNVSESIWVKTAANNRIRAAIDSTSLGLFKADQVLRIVIDGGGGNDFIRDRVDTLPATLLGGNGDDTILGSGTGDFIHGGAGDDDLEGSNGRDTIVGGSGDDCLVGGSGADLINGSTGNDYARIYDRDSVYAVESLEREPVYVDVPVLSAMLTKATVEQDGSRTSAIIDFTFSTVGWRVQIDGIRRVGTRIHIAVKLEMPTFNLPAVTETRVVVPLGNLPRDNYSVTVTGTDRIPLSNRA